MASEAKPFSTYPEDRAKLLDLARKCERSDDANAIELGDLVRAILEDEAAALGALDESGWIEWSGDECPVPGDTLVDVRMRHGAVRKGAKAGFWAAPGGNASNWSHAVPTSSDIVAYRVVAAA